MLNLKKSIFRFSLFVIIRTFFIKPCKIKFFTEKTDTNKTESFNLTPKALNSVYKYGFGVKETNLIFIF